MFEESKAWIFIVLLGTLIGIGYGANYLTSVDEANLALEESKTKLANMREIVLAKKKSWTDVEALSTTNRELSDKNSVLVKAKEVLDTRRRRVESDINYMADATKAAIEKVRSNAPNTELGDITLTNGKLLKAAKVRKLDDSGLSLIHSDGIGTVPIGLLPLEVTERFDLGPTALLPQVQQAQADFLEKVIAVAAVNNSDSTKVTAIEKRIALLKVEIDNLTNHKDKLENEVDKLAGDIKAAEEKRATTQNLRGMKDVAEGNAGMARNELKEKNLKLETLKAELEVLRKQQNK